MPTMSDVVVLLPGITGSVLEKDGKDLWNVSGGAIWQAIRGLGRNLDALRIDGVDDPELDDLGDGIEATALMPDLHLMPGLWRIDGYGKVDKQLRERLDLTSGHNYFQFPYDWRRDNRANARRLRRESHGWLKAWRQRSGNDDARLILIGHSMGGLVARAFLELEDGWKDTRRLVTFGTPFAGSLNSLDTVTNGFKKGIGPLSLDLSDTLRSMSSVYQLLPVFPCVETGGERKRVAETAGIPNLDLERAKDALEFHRSMNASAAERFEREALGYRASPILGYAQPTWLSAELDGDDLTLLRTIGGQDHGGDGTVPRPSAIPQEMAEEDQDRVVQSTAIHGSLQNADAVLDQVIGLLTIGFRPEQFKAREQSIGLDCDDVFATDEKIVVKASGPEAGVDLDVEVVDTETGTVVRDDFLGGADDDDWQTLELDPLPEGSYRLTISADGANVAAVSDLFVVFSDR